MRQWTYGMLKRRMASLCAGGSDEAEPLRRLATVCGRRLSGTKKHITSTRVAATDDALAGVTRCVTLLAGCTDEGTADGTRGRCLRMSSTQRPSIAYW
jgi:hypothetical protein